MLKIVIYVGVIALCWYYQPQIVEKLTTSKAIEVEANQPPTETKPIINIPQPIVEKYT